MEVVYYVVCLGVRVCERVYAIKLNIERHFHVSKRTLMHMSGMYRIIITYNDVIKVFLFNIISVPMHWELKPCSKATNCIYKEY